jgi:hypothetical protein
MWLGCADPVLTMEAARDSDPTLATLRDMLTAWEADMGTYEKTLGEVATLLKEQGDIYKALSDVVGRQFAQRGEVDTQRLGLWLKKNENRPVDGRRFVRAKEKGHGGEAYPVDSGNATCSVSHSGDHGIAETNSRWREGTRFPSFKLRFPTRRIVWRSCSSAVGPAVSSAPPAARLAVLR